jgi:hypothetical protein
MLRGLEVAYKLAVHNSTQPDSLMIVRCPYCVAGPEFIPMLAYKDGRCVCIWCAHTVYPGNVGYQCDCRTCIRLRRISETFTLRKAVN